MMQSPSCTSLVDAMETSSFLFDSHEQEEQFVTDMLKPLDEDYPEKQIAASEQTFPHLDKKQKVAEAFNAVTPNPLNIAMPPQQLCTPYHFPLSRPSSPSLKRPSSPSGHPNRLRKSSSTTSIKSQYNKNPTHSSSSSSLPSGSPPSSPKANGNKKVIKPKLQRGCLNVLRDPDFLCSRFLQRVYRQDYGYSSLNKKRNVDVSCSGGS